MSPGRKSSGGADPLPDAVAAVRALGIILNTRGIYNSSHPVFKRTLNDRIPILRKAMAGQTELRLRFETSQIYAGQRPVDPGSDIAERVAKSFEACGVQGIAFRPDITADDIAVLADIVSSKQTMAEGTSLQALLESRGVRSIVEFTPTETELAPADQARSGMSASRAGAGRTYELDAGSGNAETKDRGDDLDGEMDQTIREYHAFVHKTLSCLSDDRRAVQQSADAIAFEFEVQLNRRIEDVKQQTESRIRRLENIKELMLIELQELKLAAVLVDSRRIVLEANAAGREIIGGLKQIADDSPLGQFIRSGKEKQRLRINNATRIAHIIISEHVNTPEGVMLICLE